MYFCFFIFLRVLGFLGYIFLDRFVCRRVFEDVFRRYICFGMKEVELGEEGVDL